MSDAGSAQALPMRGGRGVPRAGLPRAWTVFEWLLALTASLGLGFALILMGGLAVKYQVAAVLGSLVGGAVLMHRERRLLLLLLWLLVMPLGMEKVFDTHTSIGPEFVTQYIVINAGDVLLALLAGVLLLEWHRTGACPFVGSGFATAWSLILGWSALSFAIHAFYLHDGLTHVAPLSLLTHARTLVVIVLLQSSIRDRGELITVLIVLAASLLFQSSVVMLSYVTGETYNLARIVGGPTIKPNSFGADAIVRASGTVGYTNQQAAYHAFSTLPLVALLALRNPFLRNATVAVIGLSSIAIILTFARGAWAAQVVALLLCFAIFARRGLITPTAWLQGALIAVAACLALGALSYPILQRLTHGDDGATDSRLRMISLAIDLFKGNPVIGVGPGEYVEAGYRLEPVEYKAPEWVPPGGTPTVPGIGRLEVAKAQLPDGRSMTVPLPVHNRYLLSLSELGVPGLVLWLSLFAAVVSACRRLGRSDDRLYKFLGIAGGSVVAGMLVYMMLDLFADDKSLQIVFLAPVILCAAARHAQARPLVRKRGPEMQATLEVATP